MAAITDKNLIKAEVVFSKDKKHRRLFNSLRIDSFVVKKAVMKENLSAI